MKELDSYSWMQKRAKMYSTIAESDFSGLKKVDFYFADPEAGWVDMTIRFDGKTVAELSLSGVWGSDPVADLLKWTKKCIKYNHIPHYLYHDGEGADFVFHFESLMFPPNDYRYDNCRFYDTGIFSLYIYGLKEEVFCYTLCNIADFRLNLYNAVRDFAKRQMNNGKSVKNWAWYIYDQKILSRYKENEKCDDAKDERLARKMMLDNLMSSEIEKYLRESTK